MTRAAILFALCLAGTLHAAVNEAVLQHVEKLGGRVRWVSAEQKALEVDFQFSGAKVNDAALARLPQLGPVPILRLKKTAITDAGLAHVAKLSQLRRLHLEIAPTADFEHINHGPRVVHFDLKVDHELQILGR